jgi:hypothetical protein
MKKPVNAALAAKKAKETRKLRWRDAQVSAPVANPEKRHG